MRTYDISMPLHKGTPVWPGDEPFTYTRRWNIADGNSVNLGCIGMSLHAGTHVDAPVHFTDSGPAVEQMEIGAFIGPATVVEVVGIDLIRAEDLEVDGALSTPRLLLKTGAWLDPHVFPAHVPALEASVPAFLRSRGIVLLGVDIPSVDRLESKDLPNHHALHSNGVRILESLWLADVPAGNYELIALPLRLEGADASPVRAILRPL